MATAGVVSRLGFGTSALAGSPDVYGYDVEDERARATLHAIFDGPVRLLDTSRNYGLGAGEAHIGAVITERGGLPDDMIISTKLDRDMSSDRFDAACARRSFELCLAAYFLSTAAWSLWLLWQHPCGPVG